MESQKEKEKEKIPPLLVYVCGAVERVGVYEMQEGERKMAAIEKAGGFREDAQKEALNLAEKVVDGERIYIPSQVEVSPTESEGVPFEGEKKIHLNQASKEELMKLQGVGEAKAEAILQYRQEHGGFQKVEDILNVSGIGEKLFEKIQEEIEI